MNDELDLIRYQPKPLSAMVSGKAVGGPRDGIKLTASRNWDGIVMENSVRAYNGKYIWDGEGWVWKAEPDSDDGSSRARGLAHRKRRKDSVTYGD